MNLTHNGKIGRLPLSVREELNRRLDNGERGRQLVAWLNELPETQAMIAAEFGGKPIRQQNLSDWRKGGYRNWLQQREAREMVRQLFADGADLQPSVAHPLTDQMAVLLVTRYLLVLHKMADKNPEDEANFKVMREFCHDFVALRRGDHSAVRLEMERKWQEHEIQKYKDLVAEQKKKIQDAFYTGKKSRGISKDTMRKIEEAIGRL